MRVKLHDIAHGRAGDKGNRLNVSVIVYSPVAWPIVCEAVTEARVLQLFQHRGASRVRRYVLPRLMALNFVIDEVLEGGVNASLNLDAHGKTSIYRLLGLELEVPAEVLQASRAAYALQS